MLLTFGVALRAGVLSAPRVPLRPGVLSGPGVPLKAGVLSSGVLKPGVDSNFSISLRFFAASIRLCHSHSV